MGKCFHYRRLLTDCTENQGKMFGEGDFGDLNSRQIWQPPIYASRKFYRGAIKTSLNRFQSFASNFIRPGNNDIMIATIFSLSLSFLYIYLKPSLTRCWHGTNGGKDTCASRATCNARPIFVAFAGLRGGAGFFRFQGGRVSNAVS